MLVFFIIVISNVFRLPKTLKTIALSDAFLQPVRCYLPSSPRELSTNILKETTFLRGVEESAMAAKTSF